MFDAHNNLSESISAMIDGSLADVNTAIVGVIQSFNPATQTATVQPAINRKDTDTGEDVKYPLLLDVPVVCPSGGDYYLTFPVKSGDDCLIVFSQKNIDSWFESGEIKQEAEARRHDLSDAIAIVGLKNQAKSIQNWNMNGAELRSKDGQTVIHLEDNNIKLSIGATAIELTPAGISFTVGGMSFSMGAGGTTSNMDINTSGDVIASGKSLTNHAHGGVQSGPSNTGIPI